MYDKILKLIPENTLPKGFDASDYLQTQARGNLKDEAPLPLRSRRIPSGFQEERDLKLPLLQLVKTGNKDYLLTDIAESAILAMNPNTSFKEGDILLAATCSRVRIYPVHNRDGDLYYLVIGTKDEYGMQGKPGQDRNVIRKLMEQIRGH